MKKLFILWLTAVLWTPVAACGTAAGYSQFKNGSSIADKVETEQTEDLMIQKFSGVQSKKVIQETNAYWVYELSFEREGKSIYGQLYLPKLGQEKYPTAIISHGFGSSYSAMVPYAQKLAENGIAGYVFDFCGGSTGSRSDGSTMEMSVLTEEGDLEAVLNGLWQLDFVDDRYMFLMGESQGGLVSALVAARRMEDVRGLVLLYPAFVIPDNARAQYMDISEIPEETSVFGTPVGKQYYADVLDMNVYEEIQGYTKEVLLIHGNRDNLVPIEYSQHAMEVYKSAELITLDGSGHGFYGSALEAAAQAAADHILQQCDDLDNFQEVEEQ